MGQIQTIIGRCNVGHPTSNRRFVLGTRDKKVDIQYRNLCFQLPIKAFLACVQQFQKGFRSTIADFAYGRANFREIFAFYGLPLICPEGNAYIENKENQRSLCYRFLRVNITEEEAAFLQPFLSGPNARVNAADGNLRQCIRGLLSFLPMPILEGLSRVTGKTLVPKPLLSNRFSLDLCENVHLHFQNFRLEFSREEFLQLWDWCVDVNIEEVISRDGRWVEKDDLQPRTEWDGRFQLEEQIEGHYHVHYRNARIEFKSFHEIGVRFINERTVAISPSYLGSEFMVNQPKFIGIRSVALNDLLCIVYTEVGFDLLPVTKSPVYEAIKNKNPNKYNEYLSIVRKYDPACSASWQNCTSLLDSLDIAGYQDRELIVVRGMPMRIMDGQHRACALYHRYGGTFKIKVAHFE